MDDLRNATSSWNGYLHQGKVGLLIALLKINEINKNNAEYENFIISYESAEDFDIKYNENVISRHQVKAKKKANFPNDYKDVLLKTYNEDGSINKIGFNIKSENGEEININNRYLHTIIEVKGFNLNQKDFENDFPRANYIENNLHIQLYEYPDGLSYCNLANDSQDKVKNFCLKEIGEILAYYNSEESIEEDCEEAYYRLQDLLDNKIRNAHIESEYPNIYFEEFVTLIINKEQKQIKYTTILKEEFFKSLQDFILEQQNYGTIDQIEEVHLIDVVSRINILDNDQFLQFFKNINPDKFYTDDFKRSDLIKLCKYDSLKDIFFLVLYEIKEKKFQIDKVGYLENGGYLLTIVNRNNKNTSVESVKDAIYSNLNSKKITRDLFKKKYLINHLINTELIIPDLSESTDIPKWDKERYEKIEISLSKDDNINTSTMEFIDADRAINQLKKE